MQDNAVQSRTKLRLQAELQEQEQKLVDFKLKKEKDRIELSKSIIMYRVYPVIPCKI